MKPRNRRKLLVNKPFQLKGLSVNVLGNIIIMLIIALLISWFYLIVWDGSIAYNYNAMVPVYLLALVFLVIGLVSYFGLRRSRGVAGMMLLLAKTLDEASNSVLPDSPIKFRISDPFPGLASPLNDCLDEMRSKQEKETAALEALDKILRNNEYLYDEKLKRQLQDIVFIFKGVLEK